MFDAKGQHTPPPAGAAFRSVPLLPEQSTAAFNAYADDATSLGIGSLGSGGPTLENDTQGVALYGLLDLTRDKVGLKLTRELKAVPDAVVPQLEAAHDVPKRVPAPEKLKTVKKNPFGP